MLFTQIAGSYPRPTIDEGIRIQVAQKLQPVYLIGTS